jgi:hypothetical protein
MNYINRFSGFIRGLFMPNNSSAVFNPKEVLKALIKEIDKNKRAMIDENATYVANIYRIYLSLGDYNGNRYLLKEIRNQLVFHVEDHIKNKGYLLLSKRIDLQILLDEKLSSGKVEIELVMEEPEGGQELVSMVDVSPAGKKEESKAPARATHVFEEKKTNYVEEASVVLEVKNGSETGRRINLSTGKSIFGRGHEADVLLMDPEAYLSRKHFCVTILGKTVTLDDMASGNGVSVNSKKVTNAVLNKGDLIKAGKLEIQWV